MAGSGVITEADSPAKIRAHNPSELEPSAACNRSVDARAGALRRRPFRSLGRTTARVASRPQSVDTVRICATSGWWCSRSTRTDASLQKSAALRSLVASAVSTQQTPYCTDNDGPSFACTMLCSRSRGTRSVSISTMSLRKTALTSLVSSSS